MDSITGMVVPVLKGFKCKYRISNEGSKIIILSPAGNKVKYFPLTDRYIMPDGNKGRGFSDVIQFLKQEVDRG